MTSSRAGSRAALASFSGLLALLVVQPAYAQSEDAATAQALFDDAKKAMDAGDFDTACPKFAESQRLDPGIGTLTGLALCHEKQGKTASAWAEYLEVVTEAQRANQVERAKFAKQHASDLEPRLSRLTITLDPATAKLPGLAVKRDDVVVRQASWGTALPVDPGSHKIEASATGKQKWATQVDVGPQGDSKAVAVPALEDAPAEATGTGTGTEPSTKPDETSAAPAPEHGGGNKTLGLVLGGVGVAGLIGGAIFGIEALSKSSQAKSDCPNSTCTSAEFDSANSVNSDAKTAALISDVGFGVGVVALGVGAYFFLASGGSASSGPSPAPAQAQTSKNFFQVAPFVLREGGGAAVLGSW